MSETQMPESVRRAQGSAFSKGLGWLPSALAWVALLGVAWWGHHTGWSAPSFAALFGSGVAGSEDWCAEHGVPASRCIACHPELAGESAADWCKEHGVPESKCTVCHPEILKTGVANDWCPEHQVPESCCTICHPELARRGEVAAGESEPTVTGLEPAPVHLPTPGRDPKTCQKHALKVQFASTAALAKAGVELGQVVERPMAESIAVPAEVDYDRARYGKAIARTAGIARYVGKQPGATVAQGELLAVVEAAEVGRAKSELLAAFAAQATAATTLQRLERAVAAGTRTEAERLQAEAAARAAAIRLYDAQQALLALGLPLPEGAPTPATVARLGLAEPVLTADQASANLLPVRAPLAGVIVARELVAGEAISAGQALFTIADTRWLAVMMDVGPASARRIALGAHVVFRPQSARDAAVEGTVDWIATAVDERTRTLRMRALVDNADGALPANSFGTAQVVIRPTARAIAVPNAAVQWEGCCQIVFVRLADTVFQPRKVRLGARDAAYTEVQVGLLPGEVVATVGSSVLTAAILKSNLGAGCCGDH